jgi:4-hydroxy-tetrahydrodipicolinate reductase
MVMIKIGVVGKSGRVNKIVIEEVNKRQDCNIAGILLRPEASLGTQEHFTFYNNVTELAKNVDAIIDFSNPATSLRIAKKLKNSNILLVCGTTGFSNEEFEEFKSYSNFYPIIWSANMSIGINLLHSLLKIATNKLQAGFDCAIIDIHHRHKKDSPSGTAISLAKTIIDNQGSAPQISSLRLGEEFGQHEIIFSGAHESISLSHKTSSRNSYAQGAIAACLWGYQKKNGFYTMQDVLA